jgi:hypothetical protein
VHGVATGKPGRPRPACASLGRGHLVLRRSDAAVKGIQYHGRGAWPEPGRTGSRGDIVRSVLAPISEHHLANVELEFESHVTEVDVEAGTLTYTATGKDPQLASAAGWSCRRDSRLLLVVPGDVLVTVVDARVEHAPGLSGRVPGIEGSFNYELLVSALMVEEGG